MSTNSERQAYLILRDGDDVFEGLIGPIKGGVEQANKLLALMSMLDRQLTDFVLWDDPAVCVPYLWASVGVGTFSADEVHTLMGDEPAPMPTESVDNVRPLANRSRKGSKTQDVNPSKLGD